MTVNQALFTEIDKLITEEPDSLDMSSWEGAPVPSLCGTTRCVAGWAVWLVAKDLGLLSEKDQMVNGDIRIRLADGLGLTEGGLDHLDYYGEYPINAYAVLGGRLLGLSGEQAMSLFHDHNKERVQARVKSYAATGEDLTEWGQDG